MSCPPSARLAAAASGEDADAAAHATTCLRCARVIEDQRTTMALLQRVPRRPLSERAHAELVAEVMARADAAPARRSLWSAGIVAVAAAITAIVVGPRHAATPPPPIEPAHVATAEPAPPVDPAPARTVDPAPARTVTAPVPPPPVVHPAEPKPPVHRVAPPHAPEPAHAEPHVDPAAASVAAFRTGWEALGAGRNTDAIVAFDRATDPVVAEDAAFWAAVAAERAGDHEAAARRFREFLERFPQSPHADAVRAALAR